MATVCFQHAVSRWNKVPDSAEIEVHVSVTVVMPDGRLEGDVVPVRGLQQDVDDRWGDVCGTVACLLYLRRHAAKFSATGLSVRIACLPWTARLAKDWAPLWAGRKWQSNAKSLRHRRLVQALYNMWQWAQQQRTPTVALGGAQQVPQPTSTSTTPTTTTTTATTATKVPTLTTQEELSVAAMLPSLSRLKLPQAADATQALVADGKPALQGAREQLQAQLQERLSRLHAHHEPSSSLSSVPSLSSEESTHTSASSAPQPPPPPSSHPPPPSKEYLHSLVFLARYSMEHVNATINVAQRVLADPRASSYEVGFATDLLKRDLQSRGLKREREDAS